METTQLKELLEDTKQLKEILIKVATQERVCLQDEQEEYTDLYDKVKSQIEFLQEDGLPISNPNNFESLLNWRDYYFSNLKGQASRGAYIHNIYENVINQIESELCRNHIKSTSPENLISESEPSRIEEFLEDIKQLKGIMIEVATEGAPFAIIQYEEENYTNLYRKIFFQIGILREIGLPISNPNKFRSLWQWYNHWSPQLENTQGIRTIQWLGILLS